ncbi:hypothetical protein M8C21_014342, partial [Ambrosia artemisiifolia]
MQYLGLHNISNSFTSLVESQKTKNKKVKSTYRNVRDEGNGDDSEEEYQEVDANAKVSKKQHCSRYIAPLSLNKIAKLAKQHRVTAPKISDSNTRLSTVPLEREIGTVPPAAIHHSHDIAKVTINPIPLELG